MNAKSIKIYIANETDTIASVCEKFQISKQTFNIYNPIYRNKIKLANHPIKIPVLETNREIKEVNIPLSFFLEATNNLKNIILYQLAFEINIPIFKENIIKNIENSNYEYKEKIKEIFLELIHISENYGKLDENNFIESLDKIKNSYLNFNEELFDEYIANILTYINLLYSKKYYEAETMLQEYFKQLNQ